MYICLIPCFVGTRNHNHVCALYISTVPDIRAPDVIVNEDEGTAELCVSIGNVIEREFILNYTTGEVGSGGADGMYVQYMR